MVEFVQHLLNGFLIGGIYALMGIGLTLTFGVMNVVNFAHGQFYMLGAFVVYTVFTLAGVPYVLALVVAALAVGLLGMITEQLANRSHFHHIVEWGRSAMGIYIIDILKISAALMDRCSHHLDGHLRIGIGSSDVMSVIGTTESENLTVDLCSAALGMFQFFEQEYCASLTHDKAVSGGIKWSTGVPRIVIFCQGFHISKTSYCHGGNGGICTTCNNDISITETNHTKCISYGMTGC